MPSDEAAAARYREALEESLGRFDTSDLDRACAVAEREREERRRAEARRQAASERRKRKKRLARLERLLGEPAPAEAFIAALDERDRSWRRTGAGPAGIDEALDATEGGRGRGKPPPWAHPLVVEAEATFPGAPSAAWREAGDRLDQATDARPARPAGLADALGSCPRAGARGRGARAAGVARPGEAAPWLAAGANGAAAREASPVKRGAA